MKLAENYQELHFFVVRTLETLAARQVPIELAYSDLVKVGLLGILRNQGPEAALEILGGLMGQIEEHSPGAWAAVAERANFPAPQGTA